MPDLRVVTQNSPPHVEFARHFEADKASGYKQ
jgi:hypothetical protein